MTYQYCPLCGKVTHHKHITKPHSVEHDFAECQYCGHVHHVQKHMPSFVNVWGSVHGLGGGF